MIDYLGQEGKTSPIMPPDIAVHSQINALLGEYFEQVQYGMVDDLTAHAQAFINEATITLTAPATGYDYADAYKQIVDGVETAKTAKVRSIAVFDLNGRRVVKANKGINIVKKVMSDGTVKTQKVVK